MPIRHPNRKTRFFVYFLAFLVCFPLINSAHAYWIWSPESGKFVSSDSQVSDHADEIYQHALSFRKEKKDDRAIEELQNLLRHYPHAAVAPEAEYQVGIVYEEKGDYRLAFEAYKKLLENYPQSDRVNEVVERLFKMGNLFLAGRKERVVGIAMAAGAPKAIEIFEYIVKAAPFSAFGDQAQFHAGLAYKQMKDYKSAMDAFQKVIDAYPNSNLLDDVRYQLAETSYEFSKVGTRDERAIDDAIENISDFLTRYPESTVSEKVAKLKQEIAQRDAEKNYRIGFYYESQHEFESAAFYYEDVVKRYPDTQYGKQAAQKLATLQAPIAKLRREERDITIDLDSTTAKLKSLQAERKSLGAQKGKEPSEREKNLEKEIAELTGKKSELALDQVKGIKDRQLALVRNEKDWKEKWKAFERKQKELRHNNAPELRHAFDRWKKSLLDEKEKLANERKTIAGLRGAIKESKETEEPSGAPAVSKTAVSTGATNFYGLKDLRKVRSKREGLVERRNANEKELLGIADQISAMDHQNFNLARNQSTFKGLLKAEGGDLSAKEENLAKERDALNQKIHEFESKKADYVSQFGADGVKNLVLEKPVQNLKTSEEFSASGVSLENSLEQLKQKKAKLSDSWIEQKKIVDSISALFDAGDKAAALNLSAPAPVKKDEEEKDEEVVRLERDYKKLDSRTVRKRIKFVEREIRNRLEEIEDWNAQKEKALSKLSELVQAANRPSLASKALKPITAPVRFTWWFMRSMAFGLSNDDKKIMKQAERAKHNLAPEEALQTRALQEEIQLESLLIQGRYEEVKTFQKELKALKNIADARELYLTPILIEKDFAVGEESLRSANRMISPEEHQEILVGRLGEETGKLKSIEDQINEIDRKMNEIDSAMKAAADLKASEEAKKTEAKQEDKPAGDEPRPDAEESKRKELFEALESLKRDIESGEQNYEMGKKATEDGLFSFYQNSYLSKPNSALLNEEKDFQKRRGELKQKEQELEHLIWNQKKSEKEFLLSEKGILEKYSKRLQKKLNHLKNKTQTAPYQTAYSDLESVKTDLVNVQEVLTALQNIKDK